MHLSSYGYLKLLSFLRDKYFYTTDLNCFTRVILIPRGDRIIESNTLRFYTN